MNIKFQKPATTAVPLAKFQQSPPDVSGTATTLRSGGTEFPAQIRQASQSVLKQLDAALGQLQQLKQVLSQKTSEVSSFVANAPAKGPMVELTGLGTVNPSLSQVRNVSDVQGAGSVSGVQEVSAATLQQISADSYAYVQGLTARQPPLGAGTIMAMAMDHTQQFILNLPPEAGFVMSSGGNPPGFHSDYGKVADYSMAVLSNIFLGGSAQSTLDAAISGATLLTPVGVPGNIVAGTTSGADAHTSHMMDLLRQMPREHQLAGEYDASKGGTALRADFDDGSGGQIRHTWNYVLVGYSLPRDGGGAVVNLLGNAVHEGVEGMHSGGGSRQDWVASMAGFELGQQLRHGAYLASDTGDPRSVLSFGAQLQGLMGGFESGVPANLVQKTFTLPWPSPARTESYDFVPEYAQADMLAQDVIRREAANNPLYRQLPWADNGRTSIVTP